MRIWPYLFVANWLAACSGRTDDSHPDAAVHSAGEASQGEGENETDGGPMLIASDLQEPPYQLTSDGETLFWIDQGGDLSSMVASGGQINPLVTGTVGTGLLRVDTFNVYAERDGGVYRVPKDGSSPTLIANYGTTSTGVGVRPIPS